MTQQPTITQQRCIGYQRQADDSLRSVIASQWSNGRTTYTLSWENDKGHFVTSEHQMLRPRVDVAQEPKP